MKKSSVRFKIFLTTAALLTFCAFIIYLSLYMVLPQYYYKYKKNSTSVSVNKLIEECKNESTSNGFLAIDKFVRENNCKKFATNSITSYSTLFCSFRAARK